MLLLEINSFCWLRLGQAVQVASAVRLHTRGGERGGEWGANSSQFSFTVPLTLARLLVLSSSTQARTHGRAHTYTLWGTRTSARTYTRIHILLKTVRTHALVVFIHYCWFVIRSRTVTNAWKLIVFKNFVNFFLFFFLLGSIQRVQGAWTVQGINWCTKIQEQ